MGGRIASHAAAGGRISPDGLIFFGYPLHPPGKMDRLRDAHLYSVNRPMLFFAGSRDPLCRLELLRPVLDNIPSPCELEVIEGGDHSFRVPKSFHRGETEIYTQIMERAARWIRSEAEAA